MAVRASTFSPMPSPVESSASSMNSLFTVTLTWYRRCEHKDRPGTFSPGSTMPPGMAQAPVSFLWMATNSSTCVRE